MGIPHVFTSKHCARSAIFKALGSGHEIIVRITAGHILHNLAVVPKVQSSRSR